MGKKHKKHKSDKHLYEEYVEKPLKLVLKVGGNEVTELSTGSSGHDSSLFEDKNDHDKHKDRKLKSLLKQQQEEAENREKELEQLQKGSKDVEKDKAQLQVKISELEREVTSLRRQVAEANGLKNENEELMNSMKKMQQNS